MIKHTHSYTHTRSLIHSPTEYRAECHVFIDHLTVERDRKKPTSHLIKFHDFNLYVNFILSFFLMCSNCPYDWKPDLLPLPESLSVHTVYNETWILLLLSCPYFDSKCNNHNNMIIYMIIYAWVQDQHLPLAIFILQQSCSIQGL